MPRAGSGGSQRQGWSRAGAGRRPGRSLARGFTEAAGRARGAGRRVGSERDRAVAAPMLGRVRTKLSARRDDGRGRGERGGRVGRGERGGRGLAQRPALGVSEGRGGAIAKGRGDREGAG